MSDNIALVIHEDRTISEVVVNELSIDKMYELIKCSCIDTTRVAFGDKHYTVIVDDEGALSEDRISNLHDVLNKQILYGVCIVSQYDYSTGEHIGLNKKDQEQVRANLSYDSSIGYIATIDVEKFGRYL